jgi:NAD(P)H-flavin reductase
MAATLQTVPIPAGEAWMFNHNRARLLAIATELGVEPRVVMAHAIREGLSALNTSVVVGSDTIADLVGDAETEAAAL